MTVAVPHSAFRTPHTVRQLAPPRASQLLRRQISSAGRTGNQHAQRGMGNSARGTQGESTQRAGVVGLSGPPVVEKVSDRQPQLCVLVQVHHNLQCPHTHKQTLRPKAALACERPTITRKRRPAPTGFAHRFRAHAAPTDLFICCKATEAKGRTAHCHAVPQQRGGASVSRWLQRVWWHH
jgi:hypothetical protein